MGHHHHHSHSPEVSGKNLGVCILLNCIVTIAQIVGGILSGSLSLLSDALHNFSDVLALIIGFFANRLSKRKATTNKTFGYKRAEIMAAFINSATLIIVSIFLIVEAVKRFLVPQEIGSTLVVWLSVLAIFVNGFSVLLLKNDANANLNMKSVYFHLLTDMMASIAVLVGGLLMKYHAIFWIDPLLTLLIAIYLIYVGYDLLKESTNILMLFTPKSIKVQEIVSSISRIKGIENVCHIHIWQLNERETHLEAQIAFKEDINLSTFDRILKEMEALVYHQYGINHINIQPKIGRGSSNNTIIQD